MLVFEWSDKKNAQLKTERNVSFEDVVLAIEGVGLRDTVPHPNQKKYPHQQMYIVVIRGYIYCVPFVRKNATTLFLKTVYPSRAAKSLYQSKKTDV